MSDRGEGLVGTGDSAARWSLVAVLGVVPGLEVAFDRVEEGGALVFIGVGDGCGGAPRGLSRRISFIIPGLFAIGGYVMSAGGLGAGLGRVCGIDAIIGAAAATVCCVGVSSESASAVSPGVASGSISASAFFDLVDFVVLARFDLADLAFPPAPFRFPFVVDAVDIVDRTDVVLVSIDSSRSGISVMLVVSESMVAFCDCVDNRDEARDVLDVLDARPFFALGRFDGAVVPAKWKNGHAGDLR